MDFSEKFATINFANELIHKIAHTAHKNFTAFSPLTLRLIPLQKSRESDTPASNEEKSSRGDCPEDRLNEFNLDENVEQPADRTVQILVRTSQRLDLVDRVQHRGVVFAAKLPPDLRE